MDSGKWIRELREERSVTSVDIERISWSIADVKGNADFYISHSTLCDIETGSVPSVHKLFSLAGCLTISLDKLLLAFGIDVDESRQYASQSETSLAPGSQLEVRDSRFQLNFDTKFENRETCLLRLSRKDFMGPFPPPLHRYLDPDRYRYAVIGSEDDTMGELIPPRSLVEIDVMQNAVQMSGWTTVRARPIYLIWHDNGHTCCWCEVQGNELTLLPYPLSHQPVRHFKLPRGASVVGRVTNSWLPSNYLESSDPKGCVALNKVFKSEVEKSKKAKKADKTTFEQNKLVLSELLKSKIRDIRVKKDIFRKLESVEEEAYLASLVMPPAECSEKIHRAEAALERRFYKTLNYLLALQGVKLPG